MTLCGLKDNRRLGIALAMRYLLPRNLTTHGLYAQEIEKENHAYIPETVLIYLFKTQYV